MLQTNWLGQQDLDFTSVDEAEDLGVEVGTIFLTETHVFEAWHDLDGNLKRVKGFNATVEQVELNYVKVSKNGQEVYLELGDGVRWLETEQ